MSDIKIIIAYAILKKKIIIIWLYHNYSFTHTRSDKTIISLWNCQAFALGLIVKVILGRVNKGTNPHNFSVPMPRVIHILDFCCNIHTNYNFNSYLTYVIHPQVHWKYFHIFLKFCGGLRPPQPLWLCHCYLKSWMSIVIEFLILFCYCVVK